MKKTEEEKNRAFHKIIKCIESCETRIQTINCDNMIDNFDKLFKKDFPEISYEVYLLYKKSLLKNVSMLR